MLSSLIDALREAWTSMQGSLYFLPSFPEHIDALALLSLLLIGGLLVAEWLRARWNWPRVLGYGIAGTVFGPPVLGWIDTDVLNQLRPVADVAYGLLLLEAGRRLDLRWLLRTRELLRGSASDMILSFMAIYGFAYLVVGLPPVWAAATAAITMTSAPAMVLSIVEESRAQGQVTERIMMYAGLGSAASFIVFVFVLGLVHAQQDLVWWAALAHPLWAGGGAALIGWGVSRLALVIAGQLPKRSLSQVFVLVAMVLLAVGVARMLGVPVFLTLFLMGMLLSYRDEARTLSYTNLPEVHWMLSIVLFVAVGAALPWREASWLLLAQALGLLFVRLVAKMLAMGISGGSLPIGKRMLAGIGIQPLSATAAFMALEIGRLFPEAGQAAMQLAFFSVALMDFAGPVLCRFALKQAGETPAEEPMSGGAA